MVGAQKKKSGRVACPNFRILELRTKQIETDRRSKKMFLCRRSDIDITFHYTILLILNIVILRKRKKLFVTITFILKLVKLNTKRWNTKILNRKKGSEAKYDNIKNNLFIYLQNKGKSWYFLSYIEKIKVYLLTKRDDVISNKYLSKHYLYISHIFFTSEVKVGKRDYILTLAL